MRRAHGETQCFLVLEVRPQDDERASGFHLGVGAAGWAIAQADVALDLFVRPCRYLGSSVLFCKSTSLFEG